MAKAATLIVSPEPWDGNAVSKHHYARALAASGRTVLFLEPPCNGEGNLRIRPAEGLSNVSIVSGPRVAAGLRYMPRFLRRQVEACWLSRLEEQAGLSVETVWLFENSRFFDMTFAGDRLKIYHQVDLNQDLHPHIAAATADVCLGTTDFICARLSSITPRVHKIPHGAVVVHQGETKIDPAPFRSSVINVTCVGNLGIPYLDLETLSELVRKNPQVSFHMIGKYDGETPARLVLGESANVVWWGFQPFESVARILESADIHLVCYKARQYREQLASPHKFLEYLLSGKVVVCSYTDEYKDKRHLVEMADLDQDLGEVFARVAANLKEYNSEERQAQRRAFALEHSYPNQLARIEQIVFERTGKRL